MRKILFISSDNNATSGAFLSMVKLNVLLRDKYNIYTKIILPKKGDGEELLKKENIDYQYVRSFSWIVDCERKGLKNKLRYIAKLLCQFYNIISVHKISSIIVNEGFDIVHLNTSFPYVGALAARKTDAKLVWHLREFLEEDRNIKIINRKIGYRIINKSDRIIAISDSIYNKYEKIFDKDKLVRIFNGIDVSKFYYNHDIFIGRKLNFLIVGSVSPEKGQSDVVLACAGIKRRGIDFTLNIVGRLDDQRYAHKIKAAIKENGLEDNVVFWGKRNDVQEFQKKADIIFVCSKYEAFGRVTVEAMLSGGLIIGADSAGTAEILDDGRYGLMYRFWDYNDLSEKIMSALENKKEMTDLAKLSQEHALKTYSAELNAENVAKVYDSLPFH